MRRRLVAPCALIFILLLLASSNLHARTATAQTIGTSGEQICTFLQPYVAHDTDLVPSTPPPGPKPSACVANATTVGNWGVVAVLQNWFQLGRARSELSTSAINNDMTELQHSVGELAFERTWTTTEQERFPTHSTAYAIQFARGTYVFAVSGLASDQTAMQTLAQNVDLSLVAAAFLDWYHLSRASIETFSGYSLSQIASLGGRAYVSEDDEAAVGAVKVSNDFRAQMEKAGHPVLTPAQTEALDLACLTLYFSALHDAGTGDPLFPATLSMVQVVIDLAERAIAGDNQAATALPPFVGLLIGEDMDAARARGWI